MPQRNTFRKPHRLKSRKKIDELFHEGSSFNLSPLRLIYQVAPGTTGLVAVQVLIGASKKKMKRAVHRNRAKRLMRESYRLLRTRLEEFCAQENKTLLLAILYTGEQAVPLPVMQEKMEKALSELMNKINTNGRSSSTLAH